MTQHFFQLLTSGIKKANLEGFCNICIELTISRHDIILTTSRKVEFHKKENCDSFFKK